VNVTVHFYKVLCCDGLEPNTYTESSELHVFRHLDTCIPLGIVGMSHRATSVCFTPLLMHVPPSNTSAFHKGPQGVWLSLP
jgi:hypothetical protein